MNPELEAKIDKIRLIVLDADGVLTNGNINVDHNGAEFKMFNVQDGLGIVIWRKQGFKTAIISARPCRAVQARAADLKIDHVYLNAFPKTVAYDQLLRETGLSEENVCFVGDDLTDLAVLKRSGLSVAVANAVAEVKQQADYVTEKPGGSGAVRELIELLLKTKGRWQAVLEEFTS
jgi:3-deoxy-D-manno-octulosonate 8-phosphate phosphatase (KDO 8-P phosphatase)